MSSFFAAMAALTTSRRQKLFDIFQEFPELLSQAQQQFETKQRLLRQKDVEALTKLVGMEKQQISTLVEPFLSL